MIKLVAIYCLIDPNTKSKRYVGKSSNPKLRLEQHMHPDTLKQVSYANRWKKSLADQNLVPILQIIEMVPENLWKERERFWIKKLFDEGHPLTNTSRGGQGGIHSREHMLKIIKHNKERVWSKEQRSKHSERQKLHCLQRKQDGKIKNYSSESLQSLSQKSSQNMIARRAGGWIPPSQGLFLTEKHRQKMSEVMKRIWAERRLSRSEKS